MLHLILLNNVLTVSRMVTGKDYWVGGGCENRECVALNYLDSWEKMYTESLGFIMAILSGTGFVEF